jgi:hypothetical protein
MTEIDTSGFYHPYHKLRAGKFVFGPDFELRREFKDTYTYPVQGWTWFDSAELAAAEFGCSVDELNLDLPAE